VADNASAGGFYLGPVTRRPGELRWWATPPRRWRGWPTSSPPRGGLAGRAAGVLRRGSRSGARGGRRQCHIPVGGLGSIEVAGVWRLGRAAVPTVST